MDLPQYKKQSGHISRHGYTQEQKHMVGQCGETLINMILSLLTLLLYVSPARAGKHSRQSLYNVHMTAPY